MILFMYGEKIMERLFVWQINQRNKGYCKSLIHELTKLLMDKGIEPMLYTEYNNISANRAYQSLGYENKEILICFDINL